MDQEKTSHSLALKGKITLEMTIQALYALSKELYERREHKLANRTFEGETRFNTFMATNSDKDVEQLLKSEVHLAKLKHYLEDHKVGFSYYDKGDKTYLVFEAKNRLLVEKSINQMLTDITKSPEKLKNISKMILRKPHEMSPEAKIAYYRSHTVYNNLSAAVTKDLGKEKSR
ncbi:TPA: hypothetical protein U2C09_000340 [Streptococcus suis]|nr:hypothetical protein [Streptococcus suis]